MARVYLGVGSNEGDRLALISKALKALAAEPGIAIETMAPIIETAPVGGPAQGRFLNSVAAIETTQPPQQLLQTLKRIEQSLGRIASGERWGPRPIDLDILLYDAQVVQTAELTIPHPRMHERRFVLEPLAHLAPDLAHPTLQRPIAALLAALPALPAPAGAATGEADDPWR